MNDDVKQEAIAVALKFLAANPLAHEQILRSYLAGALQIKPPLTLDWSEATDTILTEVVQQARAAARRSSLTAGTIDDVRQLILIDPFEVATSVQVTAAIDRLTLLEARVAALEAK